MLARLRRGHPYLLELGGGLLVLAVVNLLLRPKDPGFLAVQPNPALLLVAVMACRHGLRAGLVSGLGTAAIIAGCIVGRALYEGRFSLSQAIRQAKAGAAQLPGREGA